MPTLYWEDNCLYLLDQRHLPGRTEYRCCKTYLDVVNSIKEMSVRGAPAIGITAAYGMVTAAYEAVVDNFSSAEIKNIMHQAADTLIKTRPTAVNLCWAVRRMEKVFEEVQNLHQNKIFERLLHEAKIIHEEDICNNRMIGANGAELIPPKASILTHCNAGALATGGYGTALGVIRASVEEGKDIHVFIDETRPLLQGARITAYELDHDDISATLITDNMAGYVMSKNMVDMVIVGADRIATNGDTANKIGTYTLAVLANYHELPFYVAAPVSTIDMNINSGENINIEERCTTEVTHFGGKQIAPEGITVFNPAFDITPARLITAIITEKGVVYKPDRDRINELVTADPAKGN
ncbi:MAG: S-methyl-5-thioribose-1-phosphate isomerase [Bacillota bacterium]